MKQPKYRRTTHVKVVLGFKSAPAKTLVLPLRGLGHGTSLDQPYFEIDSEFYFWPKGARDIVTYRPAPSRCDYITLTAERSV